MSSRSRAAEISPSKAKAMPTTARRAPPASNTGSAIPALHPRGLRGLARSRRARWRSGFYHLAVAAGVPIGLGLLDFGRRRGGVGGFFVPTGDVRADMDRVRAFYAGIRGRRPELQCVPRLQEEDE